MKLCDFCKPFYTLKEATSGINTQPAIVEFFMGAALGELARSELVFGDDQFRKWFRGDREPTSDLWSKTAEAFDEARFSRSVSSKLNGSKLPALLNSFGIILRENEIADKFAFSAALAKQFGAIANGHGVADDIVCETYKAYLDVTDFPAYVEKSQAKYSKLKTLLYTSEERPFDEFFVCNRISRDHSQFHNVPRFHTIEDVTLQALQEHSRNVLLVGMGGIGKSMMMRHLFLTSIREYDKDKPLPILVILREFSDDNNDLFDILVDSVNRFDITFSAAHVHKLLSDGKCQVLLDGLDEIKSSDLADFQRQLDSLMDRYPDNQFVMSARRISSFVELSRFTLMDILPFSNDQALELIDRLEYCPEEPKFKQQFRDKLISEYFETHREFATNPLLLTLMLMSYHRFADVPGKKHLFYDQAYRTLLQRHDSEKLAYKRVFRSVNDPSDFTLVFREFCAKSYRRGDFEFSRNKFDRYFERLKSTSRLKLEKMNADNFLFDACNSACLMYEEGLSYHFLHRSFQEYFFADYYSREDDSTLKKLRDSIIKTDKHVFDDNSAFEMLYDLAPKKVERFIILPYLALIFDEGTLREKYWKFLRDCYIEWVYEVIDDDVVNLYKDTYHIKERQQIFENCIESGSLIISLALNILRLEEPCQMESTDPSLEYTDLVTNSLYGKLFSIDENETILMASFQIAQPYLHTGKPKQQDPRRDELVFDENGNPVVIGHIYAFRFEDGLTNPEKYQNIVNFMERDTCPAKKIFHRMEKYYQELNEKYAHADDPDDDDF